MVWDVSGPGAWMGGERRVGTRSSEGTASSPFLLNQLASEPAKDAFDQGRKWHHFRLLSVSSRDDIHKNEQNRGTALSRHWI